MHQQQQGPLKAIFNIQVEIKVTRSLMSFKRTSLVEYACQIRNFYLLQLKIYRKIVQADNRHTEKETNRDKNSYSDPSI